MRTREAVVFKLPISISGVWRIGVVLGEYQNLYKTILIEKTMPLSYGVIERRAIELYFDYLSPNGFLANLVRKNVQLSEMELVILLLEQS